MAENWESLFVSQVGEGEWLDAVRSFFPKHIVPNNIYSPAMGDVFRAFTLLKPSQVKYVVIGLDPYPYKKLATGVAFLVPKDNENEPPQSLKFLMGTLFPNEEGVDLEQWATDKGVLLINAALTIPEGATKSGEDLKAWKEFTKAVVRFLRKQKPDMDIIVFGQKAAKVAVTEASVRYCMHPAARGLSRDKFAELWGDYGPYKRGRKG